MQYDEPRSCVVMLHEWLRYYPPCYSKNQTRRKHFFCILCRHFFIVLVGAGNILVEDN